MKTPLTCLLLLALFDALTLAQHGDDKDRDDIGANALSGPQVRGVLKLVDNGDSNNNGGNENNGNGPPGPNLEIPTTLPGAPPQPTQDKPPSPETLAQTSAEQPATTADALTSSITGSEPTTSATATATSDTSTSDSSSPSSESSSSSSSATSTFGDQSTASSTSSSASSSSTSTNSDDDDGLPTFTSRRTDLPTSTTSSSRGGANASTTTGSGKSCTTYESGFQPSESWQVVCESNAAAGGGGGGVFGGGRGTSGAEAAMVLAVVLGGLVGGVVLGIPGVLF